MLRTLSRSIKLLSTDTIAYHPFPLTSISISNSSTLHSMSTDQIISKLFDPSRPLPPLEPGTKVYDKALTGEIKGLKEHKYVIACEWVILAFLGEAMV